MYFSQMPRQLLSSAMQALKLMFSCMSVLVNNLVLKNEQTWDASTITSLGLTCLVDGLMHWSVP